MFDNLDKFKKENAGQERLVSREIMQDWEEVEKCLSFAFARAFRSSMHMEEIGWGSEEEKEGMEKIRKGIAEAKIGVDLIQRYTYNR